MRGMGIMPGGALAQGNGYDGITDLLSLIQHLSMARGMDEIMRIVRTGARSLSGADGVTFVLRDGENCYYADEDAISPLWKGQRFPLTICISGWAMLHRESVVIEDIYRDARIPHDAYRLTFVKSLVMVPVRREDPIAAIGAYWATWRRPSADEVELLENIANAAAVAITNVTLMHSLQEAAELARHQAERAERQAAELQIQSEQLRRAKRDLERSNDQKSRFLAACSHDLRQPFQAMRLFHSLLAARVPDSEEQLIGLLDQAMSHGEDLLHAMLDASSIEGGLTRPVLACMALEDIFDRLRAIYVDRARAKGLALRIMPSDCWVTSDPALLTRILGNFLDNAIKFTPRGGILVGARRRGESLSIEVWDQGIGIPAESLGEIFEDFYQVGNPQRDKREGLGLGLGIVRRLADLLGHGLDVRSRPGAGSVLSVTVPLSRAESKSEPSGKNYIHVM